MTILRRICLLAAAAAVLVLTGCSGGDGHGGAVIPVDDTVPGDIPEEDGSTPELCHNDGDCPGRFCDPISGVCVDCVNDAHCGEGMICDKWVCIPVQECEEDADCFDGMVCDPVAGICVDCLTDEDCPGDKVCINQTCLVSCLDGSPCPAGTVCDPDTSACVECLSDEDCGEPQWCNVAQMLCYPDVCDPGEFVCDGNAVVECLDNGSGWSDPMPCPLDTICVDGECQEGKICVPGLITCKDEKTLSECNDDGTVVTEIPCPGNTTCQDGVCTEDCVPNCAGKECGSDGCDGSCGICNPGEECTPGGKCLGPDCMPGETICDGNVLLTCGPGGKWHPEPCPPGTTCEDGQCTIACIPNCAGKDCGPDGCGDSCGTCPIGASCNQGGICVPTCEPECPDDVECGSDGCGGLCGVCDSDEACVDGICQQSLTCVELQQCYWQCGGSEACNQQCWVDASIDAQFQWMAIMQCISAVCGQPPGEQCWQNAIGQGGECQDEWNACQECTPECEGLQCGPDGCGGVCGTCPAGFECDVHGYCLCAPQCDGKSCGHDGCGGQCGFCGTGDVCNYLGQCVCMPQCEGKECGPDGCGGSCGSCPPGSFCSDAGLCDEPQCSPGEILDCDGECAPAWLLGNGQCNDGQGGGPGNPGGGANFNCPEWEYDFGDCQEEPWYCGDGWCDYDFGESCVNCPVDCGPCGDGPCCEPHDGTGCNDPEVSACVCQFDPFCCEQYWDEICVDEAIDVCGLWCGSTDCEEICAEFECGEWENCYCGTCPPNSVCTDDGQCIEEAEGLSCQELVKCAFDCGFTATCIFECYNDGSELGQAQFQDLSLCVLPFCGALDTDCFQEAVSGPCAEEFQTCM